MRECIYCSQQERIEKRAVIIPVKSARDLVTVEALLRLTAVVNKVSLYQKITPIWLTLVAREKNGLAAVFAINQSVHSEM